LGKSFVFYTEVYVEGDFVDCVYLINKQCWAQPFAELIGRAERGSYKPTLGTNIEFYKPTEEDQTEHCTNKVNFEKCPRFTAYQSHLKAIGLEK
jgi:hypothetical protein